MLAKTDGHGTMASSVGAMDSVFGSKHSDTPGQISEAVPDDSLIIKVLET